MKTLTAKLICFSFVLLLLPLSISSANQTNEQMVEGTLLKSKRIPGEKRQIKLDEDWYSLEDTIVVYMCDQIITEKYIDDLGEFIGHQLVLEPSPEGLFNKISILCE